MFSKVWGPNDLKMDRWNSHLMVALDLFELDCVLTDCWSSTISRDAPTHPLTFHFTFSIISYYEASLKNMSYGMRLRNKTHQPCIGEFQSPMPKTWRFLRTPRRSGGCRRDRRVVHGAEGLDVFGEHLLSRGPLLVWCFWSIWYPVGWKKRETRGQKPWLEQTSGKRSKLSGPSLWKVRHGEFGVWQWLFNSFGELKTQENRELSTGRTSKGNCHQKPPNSSRPSVG